MQGIELSTEEIRGRIKATIPEGEWNHFKWNLLSDRVALSILSVCINDGSISIESVLNITEGVARILRLDAIKGMIIEGVISLAQIFALTEPPSEDFLTFFTLKDEVNDILKIKNNAEYRSLLKLFSSGVINHKQLFYLEMSAYNLLIDDLVLQAMIDGQVSLTQLQKVAELVDELLNFEGLYELIDDRDISMGCVFNCVEQYGQNAYILRNAEIQKQIKSGFMDISSLSPVDVGLLVIEHAQIEAGEISIEPLLRFGALLSMGVEQEAMIYLQSRASPETRQEFQDFTQLIMRVQKEGIGVIWKHIEDSVANLLFTIFVAWRSDKQACVDSLWSLLPPVENGVIFTEFEANCKGVVAVQCARDVWAALQREACAIFRKQLNVACQGTLGDLGMFQEQVQNSKGHAEYCLSLISRERTVFFDMAEALYPHRHSSPEAQRAHDRQYGLVVLPS